MKIALAATIAEANTHVTRGASLIVVRDAITVGVGGVRHFRRKTWLGESEIVSMADGYGCCTLGAAFVVWGSKDEIKTILTGITQPAVFALSKDAQPKDGPLADDRIRWAKLKKGDLKVWVVDGDSNNCSVRDTAKSATPPAAPKPRRNRSRGPARPPVDPPADPPAESTDTATV